MTRPYEIHLNINDEFDIKINEFILNNHLEGCFIKDTVYNTALLLKKSLLVSDLFINRISSFVTFNKYEIYENELYDRKFGHGCQSQKYNLKTLVVNVWRQ